MHLQGLQAFNFKSYGFLSADFHPRINILVGDNGQGKTNVLDMIYYLSLCKSPQRFPDSAAIRHEATNATLRASYADASQLFTVALSLKRNAPKEVLLNDTAYSRIADHIGRVPIVAIYPQDVDLTADGGDLKRRFMNATISQYEKEYLTSLQLYDLALSQRNALLKTQGYLDPVFLETLENQLVEMAAPIYRERKLLCERLLPLFQQYYALIAQNEEKPDLQYRSQLSSGDYRELLLAARATDRSLGHTSIGVHRDGIDFFLDGYPLRREGSQGQQKTFVVALRLAQYSYIAEILREKPILLLDDIFDRFDNRRIQQMLKLFATSEFGQVFITDTSTAHIASEDLAPDLALFSVANNTLTPIEHV